MAKLCAQQASDVLRASSSVDIAPDDLSARIRDALEGRQSITLAVGVIMAREGLSIEDAYGVLLGASRERAVTIREQADIVVGSTRTT